MKDELKKIVSKKTLSKDDKTKIEEYSLILGIDFKKTDCPDCHKDQALILLNKITENEHNNLKFRDNVDIIYKGMRVNKHTITAEIAQQLLDAGLKNFFINDER